MSSAVLFRIKVNFEGIKDPNSSLSDYSNLSILESNLNDHRLWKKKKADKLIQ